MQSLAVALYEHLLNNHETIAVAESCTGGLLSATLIAIPGISEVYKEGFITYSNSAKEKYLAVDDALIIKHGAVSEHVAEAMVKGLKNTSQADLCIAITGISGPGGGSDEKPVGLTYIGMMYHDDLWVCKQHFKHNNRYENQQAALRYSLEMALKFVTKSLPRH